MKTIKEINKKFDERFPHLVAFSIELAEERRTAIKSFYTQQILSLIEELEGKVIGADIVPFLSMKPVEKPIMFDQSDYYIDLGKKRFQDQMRASIKSYKLNFLL